MIKRIIQIIGINRTLTGRKKQLVISQQLALKIKFRQGLFLNILKNCFIAITIKKLLITGRKVYSTGQ